MRWPPTSRRSGPATPATRSPWPRPRRYATPASRRRRSRRSTASPAPSSNGRVPVPAVGHRVAALGGNPDEVVALLERAVAADENHAGALFGLALENDRHGNDDYARELYERAANQFPTHVGTLLNLGVLVRGHAVLRQGPAVLPADARRRFPATPGPGCSSRTPTPRATCTTTRRPAAARTASARC